MDTAPLRDAYRELLTAAAAVADVADPPRPVPSRLMEGAASST